jgi:hypothetical protein
MPTMPDPTHYDDGEVVWSAHFNDEGVGVYVGTHCVDPHNGDIDIAPIRVRVTTEDGTGSAYLTAEEAYELVHILGNAITKAKRIEREHASDEPPDNARSEP